MDGDAKRFTFRPDPDSLWGKTYPSAAYHLVTSTPGEVEALGGDELLYADGQPRGMPYIAMRTAPTREFRFAVASSMTDPAEAEPARAEIRRLCEHARDGARGRQVLVGR